MRYANESITVVVAFEAEGIPRSTFYYTLQHEPEAFEEYKAIERVKLVEQLVMTINANQQVLDTVIQDAKSEKTKPRDRLAIFLKLNDLIQQMRQNQQVDDELERQAHEFLKQGPTLVKTKSRFTATQMTVSYETET